MSIAYTLGVFYPPSLITLIFPRDAPPSPLDSSEEAQVKRKQLEKELWEIPLTQELITKSYPLDAEQVPEEYRGPPNTADISNKKEGELEYYAVRPYLNIPYSMRKHAFTAGLLQGPGRMAIPPLMFARYAE